MQHNPSQPTVAQPLICAIVLAAGLSSRMGTFKPVLELAGEKLIRRVIRSLTESAGIHEVLVVTGHERQQVDDAVGGMPGVSILFNPDFAAGEMLSSLRVALLAAQAKRAAAVALAFADQPAVEAQTVRTIVGSFAADVPLVIPTFGGKRGHPLLIARDLFPEILSLPSHETLRTVVHRHLSRAVCVEVPDPSILEDLDTPEDFERARRRYGK